MKKWKKRTISSAYQIPPTGQWRKLISRIQRPYKMAKFEKQLFNQKKFFGMTLLHAHLNISILLMQSIRNLQQKLWYKLISLYMHKQNPYLKANRKKMAHFKKLLFCQKTFFWHQTSLCKCSMSPYCVGKVLNCFGTSCGTSWIPRICTIYTRHTKLLSYR